MQIPGLPVTSAASYPFAQKSGTTLSNQAGASASQKSSTDPGVVVNISGNAAPEPSTGYTSSGASTASMPRVMVDYFSFGDKSSLGSAQGPTRLEYNVYRPDGFEIDATHDPFLVQATGEAMTPEVAEKYRDILLDVTSGRIEIYKSGKAEGLSSEAIRAKLQDYDRNLPASYKTLVGTSDMVDPATRYMNATWDETMGGPVQSI